MFCEYCGKKGHATTKSKKCTADEKAPKAYRRLDGSSLMLPEGGPFNEEDNDDDGFLMPAAILNDNHQIDCHENDLIPFDTEVQDDDGSDLDLFHDTHTWSEDEDDGFRVGKL
jgi:hypothetical protein